MDLALALRDIWRKKLWLLAVVALAIIGAALAAHKSKPLESGAARLGLVLDSRDSTIAPTDVSVAALAQRSVLYAELLKSQPLRKSIGKRMDVPWQTISVAGQVENQPGRAEATQPNQVQRSAELVDESSSMRLYFTVNSNYPIINLYAQAPTAGAAIRLVQAGADSLTDYTSDYQRKLEVPVTNRAELLQLGDPQGGVVAPGANLGIAVALALAVLFGGCFLILYIPRVVTAVRRADDGESDRPSDDLETALKKSRNISLEMLYRDALKWQYLEAQQQMQQLVDQTNSDEAESHQQQLVDQTNSDEAESHQQQLVDQTNSDEAESHQQQLVDQTNSDEAESHQPSHQVEPSSESGSRRWPSLRNR